MFKGFVSVDYVKFFQLSSSGWRGHSHKLFKSQVQLHVKKYFFQ